MNFHSPGLSGIPVIDERTDLSHIKQRGDMAGYEERDYTKHPHGSLPFAAPFSMPVIPRAEWRDRIEEMTKKLARLSDVVKRVGWKPKHQARTNFCWANGTIMAFEIARIFAGQPHVPLSPASIACIITNFSNRGGWGGQALDELSKDGAVPESLWPPNAIDRQYNSGNANAQRVRFRATDWIECAPRNFDQLMTLSLKRIPCLRADNRWSHLVAVMDPLVLPDNRFAFLCPNSGLGRDADGYTIIAETFGGPDESYGITVTT